MILAVGRFEIPDDVCYRNHIRHQILDETLEIHQKTELKHGSLNVYVIVQTFVH